MEVDGASEPVGLPDHAIAVMTIALIDDDKFELTCTCGWEGYGFPTNVIEEYVDHRVHAYRGVL